MIPLIALWATLLGAPADVTGVRVLPAADRTEIVIEVAQPMSVSDFTLSDPTRLVLDLRGGRMALGRSEYPELNRGGIIRLRASQFQPDVVRIVLDLTQPVDYTVETVDGGIRISFPNPAGSFQAWSTGPASAPLAAAQPAAMAYGAEPPPPAPAPRREEPRISVFFEDTPILDVLAHFAEFAGRTVVPGAGVAEKGGTVRADIRNQPWDIALYTILDSRGLAATEVESGIIRVDDLENLRKLTASEQFDTRVYPVKYVAVDSILESVQGLLVTTAAAGDSMRGGAGAMNPFAAQLAMSGAGAAGAGSGPGMMSGSVTANRSTNSLIVTAGKSVHDRIVPILAQLDVRAAQVNISAKVIFVERTALEELGVTYDIKDSRGNQLNQMVGGFADLDNDGEPEAVEENVVLLGGNSIAALGNANQRVGSPALQVLTSLVLNRHTLISFIEALAAVSLTDIQAAPVIRTLDHRQARVQVGENTPIRIVDAGAAATGPGGQAPRASVEMQETGTILEVTPHVTGNQILLELHAERSNVTIAPTDAGVAFQTQNADTQILLNDGETAVIAGLTIVEKRQSLSGIPFLMDLPVIGRLFRKTSDSSVKRDLLIMVTPHIIREAN